ncbi:IclR family transcriptional regulator [Nakamurella endophytica]|uniref:Glycerol operon regulatory protein n=1 Tax=Nakamurella endophytica TaxID=1748367 RepID=A0A917SW05_9ACTN|nr:IclR family transcriptional regulator [Nakamurella endophytica]GGL98232.1 transcriptional regulator [Nakamurella endophytica]
MAEDADDDEIVYSADGRRLRPVKSLMRAVDLLELMARSERPLGVTELAAASGSSKTAAYNLVTTMEFRGLVRRDAQNRYHLGWGLFELGELVRAGSDLSEAARPLVEDLAETTGETALLGILDHDSVIYLEKAESRRSIRMVEAPGQRLPLHATTSGRVLLAFADPADRARYQHTAQVPDPEALDERLARIVRDGYDASAQERDPDLTSVSVPVTGLRGSVIASLTVAGPVSRLTEQRVQECVPTLREHAALIGKAVGAGTRW